MLQEASLQKILTKINSQMLTQQLKLATAESCTGGWIAQAITSIAGCSQWFDRGFVCYSNQAKQDMLGVNRDILQNHGAVSEACARALAEGALQHSVANLSVATTGIAGPGGSSADKPVGTVWFAWAQQNGATHTICHHFTGTRDEVRYASVYYALENLLEILLAREK
jgi:nicotinamide-nucleotide amidase